MRFLKVFRSDIGGGSAGEVDIKSVPRKRTKRGEYDEISSTKSPDLPIIVSKGGKYANWRGIDAFAPKRFALAKRGASLTDRRHFRHVASRIESRPEPRTYQRASPEGISIKMKGIKTHGYGCSVDGLSATSDRYTESPNRI